MLVIATVASLLKTRGEIIELDEPVVEAADADRIPSSGPEALAEAEPRNAAQTDPAETDEERSRRPGRSHGPAPVVAKPPGPPTPAAGRRPAPGGTLLGPAGMGSAAVAVTLRRSRPTSG